MNLVRLRLAPQPRSLVGASCALEKKAAARTPHRRRSTTGVVSSDRQYTTFDERDWDDSWLGSSHSPDSLDEVRASRQQLGRPGQRSSATPTRSANENERSLRFQTLCRTLADVAKRPSSVSSRG